MEKRVFEHRNPQISRLWGVFTWGEQSRQLKGIKFEVLLPCVVDPRFSEKLDRRAGQLRGRATR